MADKTAPVTVQPAELVPYQGSRRTTRTSAEMDQIKVDVQGILDELLRLALIEPAKLREEDHARMTQLREELDIVRKAAAEKNWEIVIKSQEIPVDFERPENTLDSRWKNMDAEKVTFVAADGQRHEVYVAVPDEPGLHASNGLPPDDYDYEADV